MVLDDKDIEKLTEVFATKQEMQELIDPLATKQMVSDIEPMVENRLKSVKDEISALREQVQDTSNGFR